MKTHVDVNAPPAGGYHGGYDGIVNTAVHPAEPPQVVYSNTKDHLRNFGQALQGYEEQRNRVMEELQTMMMDIDALRSHYEMVMNEKIFIEGLAVEAEKRVQEVRDTVGRYVGVKDAVVASDGFTYEREIISKYIDYCIEESGTPISNQTKKPLTPMLIPNRSLKTLVDRLGSLLKTSDTSSTTAAAAAATTTANTATAPTSADGAIPQPKSVSASRQNGTDGGVSDSHRHREGGAGKDNGNNTTSVELNAKGERLHPCIRVYGFCNYNETCAYAKYPYDACLSNLKGKCRFRNQCHERHVEFRGPLNDDGVPLSEVQQQEKQAATAAEEKA